MAAWQLPSSLRFRVPLVVLLASIGLTTLAVVDAQRSVKTQQEVTRRALREYATFAAWSYGQHLDEALGLLSREALGAVNHGDNLHTGPRVPQARDLAHYLPWDSTCMCHRTRSGPSPESFFAFRVGSEALDVGVNSHPMQDEGWEVDRPLPAPLTPGVVGYYTSAEREWVIDSLTRRIRGAAEPDHGYSLVVGYVEGKPKIVTYTLMPTSWGDTMVYGARYSQTAFAHVLGGVLDGNGLLPATFTEGRRNREVLAIRVHDPGGHRLFDNAHSMTSPLAARLDLSARYGALSIDALIRPEVAGTLILGVSPRSRLPWTMGLLGLAAALAVIAMLQLRREGELTRMRADFVSSVSHELRTPLAQIRLYLETLRLGRAKTEAQREWSLSHIDRETTRLSHLVENVLRFSALEHTQASSDAPVDVRKEVEHIVDEFRPLAESRQAAIETRIASGPHPVTLRGDAIRHVLLNLLDNAVKYGPAGQTIRVTLNGSPDELQLSVEDQGPGIPNAERERIWQPFVRGVAAQARGGTGIGLTIVRSIVAQHGGRCRVECGTSGGARVVVTIPIPPNVGASA
jgi:signal transduction histidine kinase